MSKKNTPSTEVVGPELQKSLDIIYSSKAEIDKIGEACLQIKVTDETTSAIAAQNLSKANDMVKYIEEKRTEVKKPYLDAGKLIDQTCKDMSDLVTKAVAHLKAEIKAYEEKKQEELKKQQEELERKAKEEQEKIEKEKLRKEAIQKKIDSVSRFCKETYEKLTIPAHCDLMTKTLETKWPAKEEFAEKFEEAEEIRKNYLSLVKSKKEQLEKADVLSEEEKQLIKEKELLIKQKAELAEKERKIKEQEDAIAAEKAKKEAEEKARVEAERLAAEAASQKSAKTRKTWKFELVDKTKLSPEWITIDNEAVKKYLSEKKDDIKNGEIINGVKFWQEVSVVA